MNREKSRAGWNLALGIGIGGVFGMAMGVFMAKSDKGQNSAAGGGLKNNHTNIRNQRYEFEKEYGIGVSGKGGHEDEERIVYGHGMNYGVSGYGSGIHDSQTNISRRERERFAKGGGESGGSLHYSPTRYGFIGQSPGDETE